MRQDPKSGADLARFWFRCHSRHRAAAVLKLGCEALNRASSGAVKIPEKIFWVLSGKEGAE